MRRYPAPLNLAGRPLNIGTGLPLKALKHQCKWSRCYQKIGQVLLRLYYLQVLCSDEAGFRAGLYEVDALLGAGLESQQI